jgi:hypothetical protein
VWVCDACGRPCALLFGADRILRGSACCRARVHTERHESPAQAVLL